MKKIFSKIQRGIAELLFANILDEDYWMGVREGRVTGLRSDILYLKNVLAGCNKADARGVQKAIDALVELDKPNNVWGTK